MEALKERIRQQGQNLGNGILKVDSFLNHQVDPALMLAVGGALAAHFGALGITKVLTARGDKVTAFVRPTSDRSQLEPLVSTI